MPFVSLKSSVAIIVGLYVISWHRKYKDYVYDVSTGVLEKIKDIKELKIKTKNDMMYQDIYNCKRQNTKKRYTIHYVKPTAQMLLKKNHFLKGGPTCRRQVVNPRHQTPQSVWWHDILDCIIKALDCTYTCEYWQVMQYYMGSVILKAHVNGLVQDCSNSSALAMESLQSCSKPSMCFTNMHYRYSISRGN